MIPDFKTYLKESVWSDMQDRGTGDLEKKEDNIDNLTFEEFYDYLKSHYTYIGPGRQKNIEYYKRSSSSCILFPVLLVKWGFIAIDYEEFGDKKYTIRPDNDLINNNPDLYAKLKKRYVIKNKKSIIDQTYFSLEPVKGDIDYKFIIEVIDYILSLFEYPTFKKVNESVWSDMQDRGTGDLEKKEDDVNLLDAKDFYDYILKRYKLLDPDVKVNRFVMTHQTDISMPIYMDKSTLHLSGPIRDSFTFQLHFEMKDNGKRVITMDPTIVTGKYSVDFTTSILYKKLCDEFYVYKKHHMGLQLIHIEPKDGGNVDNMFYLKVLDFIVDNYDESEFKIIGKA